jgi:hypothetical protein
MSDNQEKSTRKPKERYKKEWIRQYARAYALILRKHKERQSKEEASQKGESDE